MVETRSGTLSQVVGTVKIVELAPERAQCGGTGAACAGYSGFEYRHGRQRPRQRRRAAGCELSGRAGDHFQRVAQRRYQLPSGRRKQHRPLHEREQSVSESGRASGVQRSDEQLQRGVWPSVRCDRQCRHALRHEHVSRQRLRVSAERRIKCAQFLCSRRRTS